MWDYRRQALDASTSIDVTMEVCHDSGWCAPGEVQLTYRGELGNVELARCPVECIGEGVFSPRCVWVYISEEGIIAGK
jgi:hypothetical protein